MKYKIFLLSAILILTILFLSGCGRGNRNVEDENGGLQNGGLNGYGGIRYGFTEETFTIFTPFGNLQRLQETAEVFRQSMLEHNINMQINFIDYTQDERQEYFDLLLGKFAAGTGPDIFVRDFHLLYPFVENNFIADIYSLIDESANFTREDFFTNVLEGIEIDGRLYMLPLSFNINYIGINANVPPQFLSRFAELDRAAPSFIANLYLELITEYPEWAEFAFIHGINEIQAFSPELSNGINFAARSVNLSHTANLLENIRLAFEGNRRFETSLDNWNFAPEDFALKQERYVFFNPPELASGIYGLFQFREPFFVNYVPLADESGQLVNRAFTTEVVVCRTANPTITMKFIEQLLSDDALNEHRFGVAVPIVRRYLRQSLEIGFRQTLAHMNLPTVIDSEGFATEQAIALIEEYSTWPSTTLKANFLFSPWQFLNPFFEFIENETTAAQAITEMEALITDWLNEVRKEIAEFEEIPVEEDLPELTVRSLTVLTNNDHTEVILQAARALNETWRQQNKPYTLNVEIEQYNFADWRAHESRRARLQTELMAGQGPDMFIFNRHEIHALAASGFLRNIYELMDACTNTQRDEFFTQALQAHEINNGLYMFPFSVSPQFIGVNAGLPQGFINRFAQKSSISFSEMMDFYIDLMNAHGNEFGHLTFDTGEMLTHSFDVLHATIGSFVDFNTRTSYLTDPRFVELLELMNRVYSNDWDVTAMNINSWSEPPLLSEQALNQVFLAQNWQWNGFDAFFTADPPIFMHHIPLADDYGRLLLAIPGGFLGGWGAVCITTTGDGELAWELTRHMIYAYTNPVGRAAVSPSIDGGPPATRGDRSFASPILRSLFEDHLRHNFNHTFAAIGSRMQTFAGFDDDDNRIAQFEAAINRIAAYNEMPMGMFSPMIPLFLFEDHFDQFRHGLLTAEAAAQRIHNAVSLWLIE